MIAQHPSPVLLTPTRTVSDMSVVPALAARMLSAMKEHKGIGLAANQIGSDLRVAVMHVPGWPEMTMVNPKIVRAKGEDTAEEGCLSVLGVRVRVTRALKVWVEYQDASGSFHTLAARGLIARCIQHECDHLDGLTCLERTATQ